MTPTTAITTPGETRGNRSIWIRFMDPIKSPWTSSRKNRTVRMKRMSKTNMDSTRRMRSKEDKKENAMRIETGCSENCLKERQPLMT